MKLNKQLITGIGGAILLAVVIGVVAANRARKSAVTKHAMATKVAQQQAPRPVKLERVQAQSTVSSRNYPGIVSASEASALSFRVGGPLTEVNVKLGEPVKKGELLMQIDPRDFEDRIRSLEAQLAGSTAQQKNAEQDYARISKLFDQKVVPQLDFDHAQNAMNMADASVKAINAQLALARHALEDTSLLAPYDGTVTKQLAENSEMVKSGAVVLNYHNIQMLEVTVSVPENEIITRSMDDSNATVSFPALSGLQLDARLKEWSSATDPVTRTYAVTFEFKAPTTYKILPGMSASIEWTAAADKPVLTVPLSAITPLADGTSAIWVVDEKTGQSEKRPVAVGKLVGAARVIVTDGLSEGEQVVVSGGRLIHEALVLKTAQ